MKLIRLETQEEFEAVIIELEGGDEERIKKSKQFEFDWAEEEDNYIFKLVEEGEGKTTEIHGLMSLIDRPDELRIHINLLENSNKNKGRNKKVDRVAGSLIAFAVQVSFEKGYYGFTSLVPKTRLIKLYMKKYGFSQFGRQLAVEGREAIKLIQKYL